MKTISLRQFRDAIPDQSEPVIVQRRDKATGEQVTLGTWTPAIPYADTWTTSTSGAPDTTFSITPRKREP